MLVFILIQLIFYIIQRNSFHPYRESEPCSAIVGGLLLGVNWVAEKLPQGPYGIPMQWKCVGKEDLRRVRT